MIEIEKIGLRNIIVHKKTDFEFSRGLTCIRGTNTSGKSLLFNTIPNVFDQCPPLARKKDSKILHGDKSAIKIRFKNQSNDYAVTQLCEKGNITYTIENNGEDITPRTSPLAKQLLKQIFPISQEQYYSTVHLTPYRANILLSGTGTQRKEFFENLFNLNYDETIVEKLKEKINYLKRIEEEKRILQDQLSDKVFVDNIDQLSDDLKKLQDDKSQASETYNSLIKLKADKASYLTYKQSIKNQDVSPNDLQSTRDQLQADLDAIKNKIERCNAQRAVYQKYVQDMETIKRLTNQISAYEQLNSSEFYIERNAKLIEQGKALQSETETQVKQLRDQADQGIAINRDIERKRALQSTIPPKLLSMGKDQVVEKFGSLKSKVESNKSLKVKLESLRGKVKCPTCDHTLDRNEIEGLLSKIEQENQKYKKILAYEDSVKQYYSLNCPDQLVDVQAINDRIKQYQDQAEGKLSKLRDQIKANNKLRDQAKEFEQIKSQISAIQSTLVKAENVTDDIGELENRASALTKAVHDLQRDLEIWDKIKHIDPAKFDQVDDYKIEQLGDQLDKINEQISHLTYQVELGKSQNEQIQKSNNRIEQINSELEDLNIYETLVKAYSAKGIRIEQIKYLANLYCENLNKYTNLVFNKDIKFYVNVDSTNFNIVAERNGNPPADVFTFSGQESRCFMLLSMISLLPFIPPALRTDFVILDEIEAGISDQNRKIIADNFFPVLKQLVSKVIVVTPMSQKEFYIDSDREYFLSLSNNQTVMEKVR